MSDITQNRLKELLHYNPETGMFNWLVERSGIKSYKQAGCSTGNGYRRIRIDGYLYLAHRLAWLYMTGEFPDIIDHINKNGLDNRFSNLRDTTCLGNMRNCKTDKRSTTGLSGVTWSIKRNRWRARVSVEGKDISLGYVLDFFEACCRRKSAENRYNFHENHGIVQ